MLILQALKITMTKHPSCFKLNGYLKEKNASVTDEVITLYEGDVRSLCPLAPNNINTMAVASMLASSLGFDKVSCYGCILSFTCDIYFHYSNMLWILVGHISKPWANGLFTGYFDLRFLFTIATGYWKAGVRSTAAWMAHSRSGRMGTRGYGFWEGFPCQH